MSAVANSIITRGFGFSPKIITRGYGVTRTITPTHVEVFGAGGGRTQKRVPKVVSPYIRSLQLKIKLSPIRATVFTPMYKESLQEEEDIIMLLAACLKETRMGCNVVRKDEKEITEVLYIVDSLLKK